MTNGWTGGQYSLFRVLFGLYLFVHFAYLTPYAAEVFSSQGMIGDGHTSPLLLLFPNPLALFDAPWVVTALAASGAVAAVLFAAGWRDKWAAAFMWFLLACLFGRNPLIANPSLPYVGWMLLAHLFIPSSPYGSATSWRREDPAGDWHFPRALFLAAWVVLALSYSYSGYTKLLSPSWVSGDNVHYVLTNPLARDWFLRDLLLWLPPLSLKLLTWFILLIELFFAPLALIARARPWLWGGMLFVQFGFAFLLNFPDLTIAMLLFHLFTFDPGWIRPKRAPEGTTLFYDGGCALCHGTVRFLLAEERPGSIRFAPIRGEAFEKSLSEAERSALPDTFVYKEQGLPPRLESDAALRCAEAAGGLWRLARSRWGCCQRPYATGDTGPWRVIDMQFSAPQTLCVP